jgi:ethanolamine ammonia-lyase large subunit
MGLRTKAGDVHAEGAYISPKLIELAKQIQSSVPGFSYFSGANDQFHQLHSPTSAHAQGLALDFVLGQQPSAEQGRQIIAQLTSLGASKVIDEYNNPSQKATAGHIHVEVPAMARGGITSGLTLAGEAGHPQVAPKDWPQQ